MTLQRQIRFQLEQGLLVKAATWTLNTSLYIPLQGNLDPLLAVIHKQITILSLVTFRKHNFFSVLLIQNVFQFCNLFVLHKALLQIVSSVTLQEGTLSGEPHDQETPWRHCSPHQRKRKCKNTKEGI